MTEAKQGLRRFLPALLILVAALVAAWIILRIEPGKDMDDDEDEGPPAAAAPAGSGAARADFVALSAEAQRAARIELATAGPGRIFRTVELAGTVLANPQRVQQVRARYPGMVRELRVAVGDRIAAGATVAIVESDDSLQPYAVRAAIDGVVTERHVGPGEHTGDAPLATITDLSSVWVEVPLFAADVAVVRPGMTAVVSAEGALNRAEGRIAFVSPVASAGSQTTTARIVLPNADGRWIPGMAVEVRVRTQEVAAAVVVPRAAVQRHEDRDVVFVAGQGGFRVQPVTLGIDDGTDVEVRSGLQGGEHVAAANSYVVLAELEKGSEPSDD